MPSWALTIYFKGHMMSIHSRIELLASLRTLMVNRFLLILVSLVSAYSAPVGIDFDDLVDGEQLSNQYFSLGVVFSPNAYSGSGGPTGDWATNTDLSGFDILGPGAGNIGEPSLGSGRAVRSFQGYLSEDGDPSVLLQFVNPIHFFSVDFLGIDTPSSSRILAIGQDGQSILGEEAALGTGQQRLQLNGASIYFVVIVPGDFEDWVAFDNVTFQASSDIPEPSTLIYYPSGAIAFYVLARVVRHRQLRDPKDF